MNNLKSYKVVMCLTIVMMSMRCTSSTQFSRNVVEKEKIGRKLKVLRHNTVVSPIGKEAASFDNTDSIDLKDPDDVSKLSLARFEELDLVNEVDAMNEGSDEEPDTISPAILNSYKCSSNDALQYSKGLIQNQINSGDRYVATKHTAAPYTRTAPAVLTSHLNSLGVNWHQHILHASPKFYQMRDCFDSEKVPYESKLEDVTETSEEFVSGCTPFRETAMVLDDLRQCIYEEFLQATEIKIQTNFMDEIIQVLSHQSGKSIKTLQQWKSYFVNSLKYVLKDVYQNEKRIYKNYLLVTDPFGDYFLKIVETASEKIVNICISDMSSNEHGTIDVSESKLQKKSPVQSIDIVTTSSSTTTATNSYYHNEVTDALTCLPPLSGSIGMLNRGLHIHDINWLSHSKSDVDTECNVHPMCARLATSQLLNFSQAKYKLVPPALKMIGRNPSFETCTNATEGNCKFFSYCWKKAIRRVCAEHSVCCPSEEVHEACKENTRSKLCKSGVCSSTVSYSPRNKTKGFFK